MNSDLLPTITISSLRNFQQTPESLKNIDVYTADCSTTDVNRHHDPLVNRNFTPKNKQPDTLVIRIPSHHKRVIIPDKFRILFDLTWYYIKNYKHIIFVVDKKGAYVLLPSEIIEAMIFNSILPEIAKKYNISLLIYEKILSYLPRCFPRVNDPIYIRGREDE